MDGLFRIRLYRRALVHRKSAIKKVMRQLWALLKATRKNYICQQFSNVVHLRHLIMSYELIKKEIMKRAIAIILAILMVATLCFALSGCKKSSTKIIGNFEFRYTKESTVARLYVLFDKGKEGSIIVIPSHLPNGLPVTSMGYESFFGFSGVANLITDKAVKLFIPNTIEKMSSAPLPESLEYVMWDYN